VLAVVGALILKDGGFAARAHPARSPNRGPPVARSTPAVVTAPAGGGGGGGGGPAAAGPADGWVLPGPSRYQGVAGVGFPDTTMGALALGYSALVARYTTDPDMAVSVVRATTLGTTPTLLAQVAHGTEALRTHFGLAPTGPTPTTIGLSLIACRLASASPSRVVAGYEGTLTVEGGSVAGTTAEVSVAIVLAWNGTDWKIDPTADLPTPDIAFPSGGSGPLPGGWHVCSEA
jgi:hypothetical protein